MKLYTLFLMLFALNTFGQIEQMKLEHLFSFKVGHSLSVTQQGVSPFSSTRKLDTRSINSIFVNTETEVTRGKHGFSLGAQFVEKGFRTDYTFVTPQIRQTTRYSYNLYYLEALLNYKHQWRKHRFIIGGVVSYLFDDDYRDSDLQIVYDHTGNPKQYFYTNASRRWPYPSRYNSWDVGFNIGYAYYLMPRLDFEITAQKGLINVDNWHTKDLAYNLSILTGFRYCPF